MLARVQQEEPQGCAIACVAMVLGVTYTEARRRCTPGAGPTGLMTHFVADAVLGEAGFAIRRIYRVGPGNVPCTPWPPAPFAPLHLAEAMTSQGGHAAVMLADGAILDPWDASRTRLDHPDYLAVHHVAGLWRVAERAA